MRVLPSSRTRPKSPAFAIMSIGARFMVVLTLSRGVTLTVRLRSKILMGAVYSGVLRFRERLLSRHDFILKSYRLLGGLAFTVPQNYRDHTTVWHSEPRALRGLRPNRSSNDVILESSDESGRVRVIQHAGAAYSSLRPGQAL